MNLRRYMRFILFLATFTAAGLLPASAEEVEVRKMERPGHVFYYPAAWHIASDQPDYDPDSNFTIDTEGRSSVTFEFFPVQPGENHAQLLSNAVYVLDGPLVDTFSRSPFTRWGKHEGSGMHLKGRVMGAFPGGARIFILTQGSRGVMITEIYYSEDLMEVMQAFEHIGDTFEFR